MILAIFGAGASYDSVPSCPPTDENGRHRFPDRLPLARELFISISTFNEVLRQYPQSFPIVPYLRSEAATTAIEHELEKLQIEAENDEQRMRQLAAVRFYLQHLIRHCESSWVSNVAYGRDENGRYGITNYVTIIDQLRRCRVGSEPVCIVTFNYDSMIESALRSVGVQIDQIDDYVSHDLYKLFKVHGSINWGQEIAKGFEDVSGKTTEVLRNELINSASDLTVSENFVVMKGDSLISPNGCALFPAIAIPVESKSSYVCPSKHLQSLKDLLKRVSRMLIVGWRGGEQHFVDLLRDHLRGTVPTLVVSGKQDEAQAIADRLRALGVPIDGTAAQGGFSAVVERREAETFLHS